MANVFRFFQQAFWGKMATQATPPTPATQAQTTQLTVPGPNLDAPKVFLIAGHGGGDPGAAGNGFSEADLTKQLRDLVANELARLQKDCLLGTGTRVDDDNIRLPGIINWVRQKAKFEDLLVDIHFNSAGPHARGAEVIVRNTHSRKELAFAEEVCNALASIQEIPNRGVRTESQTAVRRLGILHAGVHCSILIEVGFISHPADIQAYQRHKFALARRLASIIYKYLTDTNVAQN